MAKAPAFQFYVGDWMKDPELRSVSLEARGLWIDLLCLMWDSVDRGYLVARNSLAFRNDHIARMVGAPEGRIVELVNELEETGVFSRDDRGAIYCRRMVRDAQKSAQNAENGRKGGRKKADNARGSLGKPGGEPLAKPLANDLANDLAKPSPSSSSSSSSSVKEREREREEICVEVPSKDEVLIYCETGKGIPKDFASWWWSRREHDWGWERKDGRAIAWRRAVADDWASWQHKWKNRGKALNGNNRGSAQPVYGNGF